MRKSLIMFGFIGALCAGAAPVLAETSLKEDVNYSVVGLEKSEKPKVIEFFSYNCPACYNYEPTVEAWLAGKPADIQVERVPVFFDKPGGQESAEAFYVAEALGLAEKTHKPLFKRMIEDHKYFAGEDDIVAFLVEHGAQEADARKAMKSFAVKSKIGRAKAMAKKFQVMSTPTFVVNDIYTTNAQQAGGFDKLGETLTTLATK